jgi:lipopolysaccharide biosynthesis glycosyltransferase
MNELAVCLSADNNYIQHAAVVMASLLSNLDREEQVHFYLLENGLSAENKVKIEQLKTIKHFKLSYIFVEIGDFIECHCNLPHLSIASYFRLKLPSLLPQLDKVLYLDSDVVVNQCLSDIFKIDVTGRLLAAVCDPYVNNAHKDRLGINALYFNSGVMMMNLKEMRAQNCETKFFEVIAQRAKELTYDDNDVLNMVCQNQVVWLSPKYNVMQAYAKKYHAIPQKRKVLANFNQTPYTKQQLLDATNSPIIIHFIPMAKHWFYTSTHQLAYLYKQYLKLTPYRHYKFPDKTVKNIIKMLRYHMRLNFKHFSNISFKH